MISYEMWCALVSYGFGELTIADVRNLGCNVGRCVRGGAA